MAYQYSPVRFVSEASLRKCGRLTLCSVMSSSASIPPLDSIREPAQSIDTQGPRPHMPRQRQESTCTRPNTRRGKLNVIYVSLKIVTLLLPVGDILSCKIVRARTEGARPPSWILTLVLKWPQIFVDMMMVEAGISQTPSPSNS